MFHSKSARKKILILLFCILTSSFFIIYNFYIAKGKTNSLNGDYDIATYAQNINYYVSANNTTNNNIDYFVSSNGNDDSTGDIDNPFSTIYQAVSAIKNKLASTSDSATFNVYLMEGSYFFDKTLALDNINSDSKIIFKPYNNASVTFTGGVTLPSESFTSFSNSKYASLHNLPSDTMIYDLSYLNLNFDADNESIIDAPFITVNDNAINIARYPDSDFLNIDKVIDDHSFTCNSLNLSSDINKHVFLNGYWRYNWGDQLVRLNNIDNNKISFYDNLQYGISNNQKFYFLNILSGLTSSNEYYIDYDNNLLYYIPSSDLSSSKVNLALLRQPLVSINNSKNISFQNITFENGRDSAIKIQDSININIDSCTIRNFSHNAITITGGSNNSIVNNTLCNLASGGISAKAGNRASLESCNDIITRNSIYNYSRIKRTYTPAISATGVGFTISYNIIHDAPDSGIMFGGNDNKIEYNELYNICTEADDVGAIYCGRDWTARGNLIEYNTLHDIGYNSNRKSVVGIYLDDCFSSAKINENTITRTNLAMLIGGGRDNSITKNTISDCNNSITFDNRGETWANLSQISENSKNTPYYNDVWTNKYPEIKTLINNDNPGVPYNNTITGNKITNSGNPEISPSVYKNGNVNLN